MQRHIVAIAIVWFSIRTGIAVYVLSLQCCDRAQCVPPQKNICNPNYDVFFSPDLNGVIMLPDVF